MKTSKRISTDLSHWPVWAAFVEGYGLDVGIEATRLNNINRTRARMWRFAKYT